MTMHNPLISVIMPVYNGERFFEEAIASILRQNYLPLEIIIVDDGSTDATGQIVAHLGQKLASQPPWIPVHYYYQENHGPAAARNRGIKLAHGELLTFLDADDRWPIGVLHRHLKYLQDHPHVDAVQGMTQPFRQFPNGNAPRTAHTPYSKDPTHAEHNHETSEEWAELTWSPKMDSGLFRRTAFNQVGLLEETLLIAEDLDWFLRAREAELDIVLLPDVAVEYRRHTHNMTNRRSATETAKFQALQASIHRRRHSARE